jgi:hypothetical protein
MTTSESRTDNKSQADKFREAAKEVETDDDEKRFDEKLRRITKAPQKKQRSRIKARGNPP